MLLLVDIVCLVSSQPAVVVDPAVLGGSVFPGVQQGAKGAVAVVDSIPVAVFRLF